jgi:hypothetical protein
VAAAALRRQVLEVGAVCPNWARTDLCGGRLATAVPTAKVPPAAVFWGKSGPRKFRDRRGMRATRVFA